MFVLAFESRGENAGVIQERYQEHPLGATSLEEAKKEAQTTWLALQKSTPVVYLMHPSIIMEPRRCPPRPIHPLLSPQLRWVEDHRVEFTHIPLEELPNPLKGKK